MFFFWERMGLVKLSETFVNYLTCKSCFFFDLVLCLLEGVLSLGWSLKVASLCFIFSFGISFLDEFSNGSLAFLIGPLFGHSVVFSSWLCFVGWALSRDLPRIFDKSKEQMIPFGRLGKWVKSLNLEPLFSKTQKQAASTALRLSDLKFHFITSKESKIHFESCALTSFYRSSLHC